MPLRKGSSQALAFLVATVIGTSVIGWACAGRPATVVKDQFYYTLEMGGAVLGSVRTQQEVQRFVEHGAWRTAGEGPAHPGGPPLLSVRLMPARSAPFVMDVRRPLAEVAAADTAAALNVNLVPAFAIVVDGQDTVAVADRAAAEAVIKAIVDEYREVFLKSATKIEDIRIVESISVRPKNVSAASVRTPEQAKNILKRGTDKLVFHTVQRGDTLWGIAQTFGTDVETLVKANPGVNPEALQIGQQVSVTFAEPYVHLESSEVLTYTEAIAFPEEVGEDANLWPWQYRVVVPGVYGQRQVTVRNVRRDGRIVGSEVLENKVLSEPKPQKSVRGTKTAPNRGTGTFHWPLGGGGGRITSYFGPRWGTHHPGIDIGAPAGTPVVAADSGTVTLVGWYGNYGYTVMVDHGGGNTVTLYAHLSEFAVKQGQQVDKGETVGYVGNTGYSTGPHLHFEVRVNNRAVNPLQFYP